MERKEIIWSNSAKIKLFEILDFYKSRNQSSEYSIKIFTKINKNIALLKKHPEIGIKTDISSVRALSVENYLVFYKTEPQRIIILSIWDTRQNPLKIPIKKQL